MAHTSIKKSPAGIRRLISVGLVFQLLATGSVWAQEANPIRFEDVTEKLGLKQALKGWELGHGAAWGDVDGDGRPDLYFGTFASGGRFEQVSANMPNPNMLFLNKPSGFVLSDEQELRLIGRRDRTSGALFVDLNNDGKLDLIVCNHYGQGSADGTLLYENLGDGHFRDVTPKDPNQQAMATDRGDRARERAAKDPKDAKDAKGGKGKSAPGKKAPAAPAPAAPEPAPQPMVWPGVIGVRNVAAIDLNNDGLLDLIFCDGSYGPTRFNPRWRLIALLNKGNFQFEDVSAKYGFTPVPPGHSRP